MFIATFILPYYVAQAQTGTASSSPPPTFTLSARRVIVDVTVTDSEGQPVHGLSKEDFTVKEDGVVQSVLSFEPFDFAKDKDSVALAPALTRANTFMNLPRDPERGPLYVLLYDLVNIAPADQIPARAALLRFVSNKPPGTRFALFLRSDRLHLVQGFTSDQQSLVSAVEGKGVPKVFMMGANFGQDSKAASLDAIQSIVQFLTPATRRKNLIWFSSSFPLSLFLSQADPADLQEVEKRELNRLTANQISIYPVDVSGVVVADEYGESTGENEITPDKPKNPLVGHGNSLVSHSQMVEDALANATGGEAIYSSNDIAGSLRRATLDGGNYYSLSYSPSNMQFDGHLREIHVSLNQERKGYHLVYRRAYCGIRGPGAAALAGKDMAGVMTHGAPEFHDLIFGLEVVPSNAAGHEKKQKFVLAYRLMASPRSAGGAEDASNFEIAAAAYGADGQLLNSIVNKATAPEIDTQESNKKSFRVEQELDVPIASHTLRVAVRNLQTGKAGAMEISLPLAATH